MQTVPVLPVRGGDQHYQAHDEQEKLGQNPEAGQNIEHNGGACERGAHNHHNIERQTRQQHHGRQKEKRHGVGQAHQPQEGGDNG